MFFDKCSSLFGLLKIYFLKIIYFRRIKLNKILKIKRNFKMIVDKNSRIILGKRIRIRENFYARCENGGILEIGDQCFINNNANLISLEKITIGNNVSIGQNVVILDHDHDFKNDFKNFVTKPVKIGNHVWIGANVTILKGVTIGNNCIIAANTTITKNVEDNCLVRENKQLNIVKTSIKK